MPTQLNPVAPGLPITPVANASDVTGNYIVPDGDVVLRITNGSASSITFTLDDPTTPTPEGAGAINPDAVFTIAASAVRYVVLNARRRRRFTNPTNGRISWTVVTAATTVLIEVIPI